MNNAAAILVMYDTILSKKTFNIKELETATNFSRRTCFRYLKAIKHHLSIYHPELEISYNKHLKTFSLTKVEKA